MRDSRDLIARLAGRIERGYWSIGSVLFPLRCPYTAVMMVL
jgi:hypothetical protein